MPRLARDLVAMVDGFTTPAHWRARVARGRWEAWLGELVTRVRDGALTVPSSSALAVVSRHRHQQRCPGEPTTVSVLRTLAVRLTQLHRIPAHVRSGFVLVPAR